jgi:hypothetical protein
MNDRREWEQATAATRHLAIAADAELRRRHPETRIDSLRSAEPEPVSETEREDLVLTPGDDIREMAVWIQALAAERRAFREKLEERQALTMPSEDPDHEDLGPAFPASATPECDAILQPPKPEITPSGKIVELARQGDATPEAADLRRAAAHHSRREEVPGMPAIPIPDPLPPAITLPREVIDFAVEQHLEEFGEDSLVARTWTWILHGGGPAPISHMDWKQVDGDGPPSAATLTAESTAEEPPLSGRAPWADLNKARFICWWCTALPGDEVPLRFQHREVAHTDVVTEIGSVTVTVRDSSA